MSNKELARRAVASKHWRRIGGMLMFRPDDEHERRWRLVWAQVPTVGTSAYLERGPRMREPIHEARLLPDLDDPATLGCLLALVREAWGEPKANVEWLVDDWGVFDALANTIATGATEAAALVAALEAAP